jgi:hypothetical protein
LHEQCAASVTKGRIGHTSFYCIFCCFKEPENRARNAETIFGRRRHHQRPNLFCKFEWNEELAKKATAIPANQKGADVTCASKEYCRKNDGILNDVCRVCYKRIHDICSATHRISDVQMCAMCYLNEVPNGNIQEQFKKTDQTSPGSMYYQVVAKSKQAESESRSNADMSDKIKSVKTEIADAPSTRPKPGPCVNLGYCRSQTKIGVYAVTFCSTCRSPLHEGCAASVSLRLGRERQFHCIFCCLKLPGNKAKYPEDFSLTGAEQGLGKFSWSEDLAKFASKEQIVVRHTCASKEYCRKKDGILNDVCRVCHERIHVICSPTYRIVKLQMCAICYLRKHPEGNINEEFKKSDQTPAGSLFSSTSTVAPPAAESVVRSHTPSPVQELQLPCCSWGYCKAPGFTVKGKCVRCKGEVHRQCAANIEKKNKDKVVLTCVMCYKKLHPLFDCEIVGFTWNDTLAKLLTAPARRKRTAEQPTPGSPVFSKRSRQSLSSSKLDK